MRGLAVDFLRPVCQNKIENVYEMNPKVENHSGILSWRLIRMDIAPGDVLYLAQALQLLLHLLDSRVKPKKITDSQDKLLLLRQIYEFLRRSGVIRDRLLNKDMHARVQAIFHNLVMQIRRDNDRDSVHLLQHLPVIGEERNLILLRQLLPLWVDVRQPDKFAV